MSQESAHPHETSASHAASGPPGEGVWMRLESRPQRLIAARYVPLPFPQMAPMQEIVFDLGITAMGGDLLLTGLVIKAYREHQMLFEQRWPHGMLQRHTGEADLTIEAGTGLAVRGLHFMLHGYEDIHYVDLIALARHGDPAASIQARLQIPVRYHEQQTDLHFPLRGAWWVVQAGDWSDLHKQEPVSQPFALDFVRLGSDNRFFRGSGAALEDHYSWNEPVHAAAGGKVAFVQFDMPDMAPGMMPDPRMLRGDPRRILGNAVAVSHANGEFTYYAHLQQASVEVNEGQVIKRGTLLGRVGNSGRSPGPHLHFHLMEGPNLFLDQGLPVRFSHFEAAGQYFDQPTFLPTRMIVHGPARGPEEAP